LGWRLELRLGVGLGLGLRSGSGLGLELGLGLGLGVGFAPHRRLDPLGFGEAYFVVERGGALVGPGVGCHDLLNVSMVFPGVQERGGGAWRAEGGEISHFDGGSLAHPRQWLGARWAGLPRGHVHAHVHAHAHAHAHAHVHAQVHVPRGAPCRPEPPGGAVRWPGRRAGALPRAHCPGGTLSLLWCRVDPPP